MAIRINTIEYGWETNQSTISGSEVYTSPSKSIWIAETGSRTFIAADLHLYVRDGISGTGIPSRFYSSSYGIWIDNNYVTQSITHTLSTAGDHFGIKNVLNFKSHFNTYFTGSNHICQFTWNQPTGSSALPWTGHAGKLILTYQYDDTNLITGTKTVRIPLQSVPGYMGIVTQSFGPQTVTGSSTYRNVPILDSWLPENNKTYRDLFFEIVSKDASAATTAVSMSLMIDSGSESVRCCISSSLNTALEIFDIYNVSGTMDTSTSHVLKGRSSLASRIVNTSPVLLVTYEYDYSSSQVIMNSLVFPLTLNINNRFTDILSVNRDRYFQADIFVPETNPVLKTSGFLGWWYSSLVPTYTFYDNSSYILLMGTSDSGGNSLLKLFDSESIQQTASFNTFNRGNNSLVFSERSNMLNPDTSLFKTAILNYTSDNLIPGKHNKTIYLSETQSLHVPSNTSMLYLDYKNRSNLSSDVTSSYFLQHVLLRREINGLYSTVSSFIELHLTGSTFNSSSYFQTSRIAGDNRTGPGKFHFILDDIYSNQKYRAGFTKNLEYFTNRSKMLHGSTIGTSLISIYDLITIHHLTYPISCSLLNTNFPSEQYDVNFYLSGSADEPINILSLSGSSTNKSGSFDWYDNFQNIYAVCYKPEFGISNMLPANSGSHTIDFSTPTAGGEHSFTFIG